MKQELMTCHVAGLQYSKYQLVENKLKTNTKLRIIGEPSNPHDNRAIKVQLGETRVGYIPRHMTEEIWTAHDAGAKIHAEVVSYNRENPTWQKLVITVIAVYPKDVKKRTANGDVEM